MLLGSCGHHRKAAAGRKKRMRLVNHSPGDTKPARCGCSRAKIPARRCRNPVKSLVGCGNTARFREKGLGLRSNTLVGGDRGLGVGDKTVGFCGKPLVVWVNAPGVGHKATGGCDGGLRVRRGGLVASGNRLGGYCSPAVPGGEPPGVCRATVVAILPAARFERGSS